MHTTNDLTDADFGSEISAADRRVESGNPVSFVVGIRQTDSLFSLLVCCVLIIESSSVLHSDGIALLCLVGAVARADHCLGDAHVV